MFTNAALADYTVTFIGNTINHSTGGATSVAIGSSGATSAMTITEITNNTINNSFGGGSTALFLGANGGSLNIGPITGNSITNTDAASGATVVAVAAVAIGVINLNGAVSGNTFVNAGIGAAVDLVTLGVAGGSVNLSGGFTNNSIASNNVGAGAFGLRLAPSFTGTSVTVTGVTGNTFTSTGAAVSINLNAIVGSIAIINVNNGATSLIASNTLANGTSAIGVGVEVFNPS